MDQEPKPATQAEQDEMKSMLKLIVIAIVLAFAIALILRPYVKKTQEDPKTPSSAVR